MDDREWKSPVQTPEQRNEIVRALAVVCELTDTRFSEPAIGVIVRKLSVYPHDAVLRGLMRSAEDCGTGEYRRRLTLADLLERVRAERRVPGGQKALPSSTAQTPEERARLKALIAEMVRKFS